MKCIFYLLSAALLIFGSAGSAAEESLCTRPVKAGSSWLEHREGEFIIQYALEGRHALTSLRVSGNGVPDVVSDAALQLTVMRDMLASMGFQHPLESTRYRSQGATHILVRFRSLQNATGLAFDEVGRLPTGECVLTVHINSSYKSGNFTPAHEYFHLVQYGYTMFKRPWYLEGMARWAEDILGKRQVEPLSFPIEYSEFEAVFKQSYKADSMWYGLIRYCDSDFSDLQSIPKHMDGLTYTTGEAVLMDKTVPGKIFIKRILESYSQRDALVSEQEALPEHNWPEKFQRDPQHDSLMWDVLASECINRAPLVQKKD